MQAKQSPLCIIAEVLLWLGLRSVFQDPDGWWEEVDLKSGDYDSGAPEFSFIRYQRDESMAGMVWAFNDICCLFEVAFPADSFDGGEVNTCDGLGLGDTFSSYLCFRVFKWLNQMWCNQLLFSLPYTCRSSIVFSATWRISSIFWEGGGIAELSLWSKMAAVVDTEKQGCR